MRLLLVTGAGASCSLAPKGSAELALMNDWAERLCIKIGPEFATMSRLDLARTGPEFEETLGALLRWERTFDMTTRFAGMTKPAPADGESMPQAVTNGINHARANLRSLTRALHDSLFEEFGPARVDPKKASAVYRILMEHIVAVGGSFTHVAFATTNYDRSLELALPDLGFKPRTGFNAHPVNPATLNTEGLGTFVEDAPAVMYLHGAVGWYLTPTGITALPPALGYIEGVGAPAVLYPDPEKDLELTETASLWQEFLTAADEATHILVVGHSMHDQHLANALKTASEGASLGYVFHDPVGGSDPEFDRVGEALGRGLHFIAGVCGPKGDYDRYALKEWVDDARE